MASTRDQTLNDERSNYYDDPPAPRSGGGPPGRLVGPAGHRQPWWTCASPAATPCGPPTPP
ncbi:MAG: hypothetical protein R3F43_01255 [bacterium]